MRRVSILLLCMIVSANCGFFGDIANPSRIFSEKPPKMWFGPAPGSRDFLRMFEHPEEWELARSRMDTFAFSTGEISCSRGCKPASYFDKNTYENFLAVDAFRKLRAWNIKIALEGGSVKEYTCKNNRDATVTGALIALRNLDAGGHRASYFSMDEPFFYGQPNWLGVSCNLSAEEVADLVKYFVESVHIEFPDVQIGLIEPYPTFTVEQIKHYVNLLEARGVKPPYFHLDYFRFGTLWGDQDERSDFQELKRFFKSKNIPFGVIIFGSDKSSNLNYSADAMLLATEVRGAMGTPDRLIVESWSSLLLDKQESYKIYPTNIPEVDPTTHTGLFNQIYEMFTDQ